MEYPEGKGFSIKHTDKRTQTQGVNTCRKPEGFDRGLWREQIFLATLIINMLLRVNIKG